MSCPSSRRPHGGPGPHVHRTRGYCGSARSSATTTLATVAMWTLLLAPFGAAALPPEEEDGDSQPWIIPSFALGVGVYTRDIESSAFGVFSDSAGTLVLRDPREALVFPFQEPTGAQRTTALDGQAIPFTLQFATKDFDLPGKPYIWFHGGYMEPFRSRTLAQDGDKPEDFDTNPVFSQGCTIFVEDCPGDTRLQIKASPDSYWFIGAGAAARLPLDFAPVWVRLGVSYMEEEITYRGTIFQTFDQTNPIVPATFLEDEVTIRSISPTIGLEAEVARVGPIAISILGETFLSIALDNEERSFSFQAPGQGFPDNPNGGQGNFTFDPDTLHVFGGAHLRFSWIGGFGLD